MLSSHQQKIWPVNNICKFKKVVILTESKKFVEVLLGKYSIWLSHWTNNLRKLFYKNMHLYIFYWEWDIVMYLISVEYIINVEKCTTVDKIHPQLIFVLSIDRCNVSTIISTIWRSCIDVCGMYRLWRGLWQLIEKILWIQFLRSEQIQNHVNVEKLYFFRQK